ncbi:MAG: hypothetical protein ACLQNG_08500 [Acidimicrobiales bacterium]
MQILMTEIATDRARTAAALLEAKGHVIVTCGDGVARSVTCAALRGEPCPLERDKIDVALHIEGADPPGLADEGVLCAIRHFLPLVVASRESGVRSDPFGSWAAAVCDLDELSETLTAAASAPLPAHSLAAERAANAVLASAGCYTTWRAVVRRSGGRLRVELISETPVDRELCDRSAVRAEVAIREIDGVTPTIDVEIVAPPHS